jgi:hypothetical protein
MTTLKVNNFFLPSNLPAPLSSVGYQGPTTGGPGPVPGEPFSEEQLGRFRETARGPAGELQAYGDITRQLPSKDLSETEK